MAPPLMETSISDTAKWSVACTRTRIHTQTCIDMHSFHTSNPLVNRGSECAQGHVPCFNYWGFFVMDLIIDIFFTADIVINFRTAWIDTGLV